MGRAGLHLHYYIAAHDTLHFVNHLCLFEYRKFIFCWIYLKWFPSTPAASVTSNSSDGESTTGNNSSNSISRQMYIHYAVPIGIFTGLDVALGNFSFVYITVTLYTIVKSSLLIFVLIFGVSLTSSFTSFNHDHIYSCFLCWIIYYNLLLHKT